MIPRQINLSKIQKYLMDIESDVQANNYYSFYDINIISESFCKDLLNLTFEIKLENVNLFKNNEKAIDLADKNRGIAIQVTSEKSLNKIKHTFEEYIDAGLDEKYPDLYIITLIKYDPSISIYEYKHKKFNVKTHVVDYRQYIKILLNKYDNNKYKEILKFLDGEFEINNYTQIYNKYTEKLMFELEKDIKDAIVGNRLYPYNVKSCPELPAIKEIEKTLDHQDYCVITGEAGCGKSITAYQIGYRYYVKGWNVYRFLNITNEFEYNIFSSFKDNTLLIVDDIQVLNNFQIDRIVSKVNPKIKVVVTATDTLAINDNSTTYLLNQESIEKLSEEYLKRKKEIYPIIKEMDNWVGDSYGDETIDMRIERASTQKTPWLFNFVLRGGWNKAKVDFERIKSRNEADKLLVVLSILQILYLDKAISKSELLKNCEFLKKDIEWFDNNFKYLKENKIIIEEYDKYRCAHIRYSTIFLNTYINYSENEALDNLLNLLRSLIVNSNYPLQGIYWLLDNIDSYDKGYYIKSNLIKDNELLDIFNICFSVIENIDIRNSIFILNTLNSYNKKVLNMIEEEKYIKKLSTWIENVNNHTGYALSRIINDFFINEKLNINLLLTHIDIKKLINTINQCEPKAIGCISEMLERLLYADKDKTISKRIIYEININTLSKKINETYKDLYLDEFLNILSLIKLYDEPSGILLYKKTKECIRYYFKENALKAYENADNRFIWCFLEYPLFSNKKPKVKYRNIAKEIISSIDTEKLANQISNTNLHDMERYSRLLHWISDVDFDITKKVVNLIIFDEIDANMTNYFEEPPRELRLFIYSIGITEDKKFYNWMDKHFTEIKIADPLVSSVYPQIVKNCIDNSYKINIFGHNDSFEEALLMISNLKEYNSELCRSVLNISIDSINNRIKNLKYTCDFTCDSIYNFMNYINHNFNDIFFEIINSIDIIEIKKNLDDCYKKIIDNNDQVKNNMLIEFKNILRILKLNTDLEDFCDNLMND